MYIIIVHTYIFLIVGYLTVTPCCERLGRITRDMVELCDRQGARYLAPSLYITTLALVVDTPYDRSHYDLNNCAPLNRLFRAVHGMSVQWRTILASAYRTARG